MEPTQTVDLLLIEVGRAISAKNADTVRGAITQLQSLLDTLKAAEDAEETAEGEGVVAEAVDPNVGQLLEMWESGAAIPTAALMTYPEAFA